MTVIVTVLGCGGSGGVPLVGDIWGDCNPNEPKNRRRRPSLLVQNEATTLLVDAGPDLREQLLDAQVTNVDAVLFTHAHADHCHGLDDLRPLVYKRKRPIPAYADPNTLNALKMRFEYAFEEIQAEKTFYSPLLRGIAIDPGHSFSVGPFDCISFWQTHGNMPTVGYRIGNIGYSPDAADLSAAAFEILQGIDLWVVDCLRYEPHPTHAHFEKTLSWIEKIKPRQAVFTHMNHQLDYHHVTTRCPDGVTPGYDGMRIFCS